MDVPAYNAIMNTPLPRSSPEAQGISSRAISAFVTALNGIDSVHSVMVVRHGHVVAEGWWAPYQKQDTHVLYSLSKSFTSSAIGLLVDAGKLALTDKVVSFFPAETPADASAHLRAMTIHDLLSMSTGHVTEPALVRGENGPLTWVQSFLTHPVVHAPGTYFLYNSPSTYMCSAIVTAVTGMRMIDYLRPRLFAPLGIQNPTWETSPQGIDVGGWGLRVSTDDIAAFGQMYLQKGMWQGAQLLSEAWVARATTSHVSNAPAATEEWQQGYGYQFWRCRHNAYRGDGAFGQYCVVLPDQDAVIAITSGLAGTMQAPMDAIWEHLLPALGASAVPESPAEHQSLKAQLAGLRLAPVTGGGSANGAVSGKTYTLAENLSGFATLRLECAPDGDAITVATATGEHRIALGHGRWSMGETQLPPQAIPFSSVASPIALRHSVAASGAWEADGTYVAKIWWNHTPFARTMTFRFANNRMVATQIANANMGLLEGPVLRGWI